MSTKTKLENPGNARRMKSFAVLAMAVLTALTLAVPASAMPTGPGVRAGKNLAVFGNLDFVAAFGYPLGQKLTVDVYRGDTRIATAFGPAIVTDEGGALEVNHGPEGTPAQGDCWEYFTPDVLPGDRIVVTDAAGGTDQVLVDDITISGPPEEDLTTIEDETDIVVKGTASYANGEPIPIPNLDSGEMRLGSDFRANPNEVVRTPGTENGWTATYRAPYLAFKGQGLPLAQQKQAILDGDHAMGYGHIEPLPAETQLAEGLGGGGPAPGCEASAPDAPASAMGVLAPTLVSQANAAGTVEASGVIQDGVEVALQLNGAAGPAAEVDRENGTWSAQIPAADLQEGDNEVKATFTGTDAPDQPQTANVEKDTTPPAAATATPKPGLYKTDQSVSLGVAEAGAKIRFTTDGTDPTATTGTLYDGQQIRITSDTTIKTVTMDSAGNVGEVTPLTYQIDKVLPNLSASLENGSYDSAQQMAFTSDSADLKEIRYTTNGTTPTATQGTVYSGPIGVTRSTSFKAVAIDRANNVSPVLERAITIRAATRTSLAVASTDLKLGKSRLIQGAVSPNQADGTVALTIDRPGALPNFKRNLKVDAFSRFSRTYKPTAPGVYKVKASFLQDEDALGSTSVVKSFRVVR